MPGRSWTLLSIFGEHGCTGNAYRETERRFSSLLPYFKSLGGTVHRTQVLREVDTPDGHTSGEYLNQAALPMLRMCGGLGFSSPSAPQTDESLLLPRN